MSAVMSRPSADYTAPDLRSIDELDAAIGRLVRQSEETGVELHDLPMRAFTEAHPEFGSDVVEALSARHSLQRRDVEGGTGIAAVRRQIELAQQSVDPPPETRANEVADRGM